MVFGIRVSYHDAQKASASRPPVCPCARCFNASDDMSPRLTYRSPAREVRIPPCGHHATTSPFSGLMGASSRKMKIGFGLGRRRSVDTVASDMRPLQKAAQEISVEESSDEQSVLYEKF